MKKISADLTVGEQRQVEKQEGRSRYFNRKRDQRRANGEQRLRPIVKREQTEDEDLVGIDLRRVKYLSDLNLE